MAVTGSFCDKRPDCSSVLWSSVECLVARSVRNRAKTKLMRRIKIADDDITQVSLNSIVSLLIVKAAVPRYGGPRETKRQGLSGQATVKPLE